MKLTETQTMSEEEQDVIVNAVELIRTWDEGHPGDRADRLAHLRHSVRNLLLEDADKWT